MSEKVDCGGGGGLANATSIEERWAKLTRGVPAHVVARAMNRVDRGSNWTRASKAMMREKYVGTVKYSRPFTGAQRRDFQDALETAVADHAKRCERRAADEKLKADERLRVDALPKLARQADVSFSARQVVYEARQYITRTCKPEALNDVMVDLIDACADLPPFGNSAEARAKAARLAVLSLAYLACLDGEALSEPSPGGEP